MPTKILQLKALILQKLTPIIDRDYRYLMMCDHQNVGDTLIMQGEFNFFSTIKKYKCKEYTTMWSFKNRHPIIPKDDLLIMRGSGSFGDIWPTAPNFWKFVMRNYPENPILFMPQTIHFNDNRNLQEMANFINNHKKITLCLRDKESYEIAEKNFNCEIRLVPDMAFFMPVKKRFSHVPSSDKELLVKRKDKESKNSNFTNNLISKKNIHISDWPTFSNYGTVEKIKKFLLKKKYYKLYDKFIKSVYSSYITSQGLYFLHPHSKVYATRMHAGILAMMMDKDVVFIDNNYGKLRKFYDTWLQGVENIRLETK